MSPPSRPRCPRVRKRFSATTLKANNFSDRGELTFSFCSTFSFFIKFHLYSKAMSFFTDLPSPTHSFLFLFCHSTLSLTRLSLIIFTCPTFSKPNGLTKAFTWTASRRGGAPYLPGLRGDGPARLIAQTYLTILT